jgi:hypothetical protein
MAERCEQCRNPHHDGICTCGQWGEAEEAKAAEWYKNNPPRPVSHPLPKPLPKHTDEELETLWTGADTSQGPPPPWSSDDVGFVADGRRD